MMAFAMDENAPGAAGMLVEHEDMMPCDSGILIYFTTSDVDATLARVERHGGKVRIPRTDIGQYGHMAEFTDPEGNRLALHAMK